MRDRDSELIAAIKEYNSQLRESAHTDTEPHDSDGDRARFGSLEDEHKAVVYACLKHSNTNELGALAAGERCLYFYSLNVFLVQWKVVELSTLPLEAITKIKISKSLIWHNLEVSFKDDKGNEYTLNYRISNVVVGLKKQRANVKTLLSHLRACAK